MEATDVAEDVRYLGDSVYLGWERTTEGPVAVLFTWNGLTEDPRNKIYLEPDVIAQLGLAFLEKGAERGGAKWVS